MRVQSSLVALGVLGLGLSSACAKLNPAFQDSGGETESGGGSRTGTATEGPSTDTADSASGSATSTGVESDGPTTTPPTDSNSSSAGSSGESGDVVPPRPPTCVFTDQETTPCDTVVAMEQGFNCELGLFNPSGTACEPDFLSTVQVTLNPGRYVMGAVGIPNATYSVSSPNGTLLECAEDNPVFELNSDGPVAVDFDIANVRNGSFGLWLRDVNSLCDVAQNCCNASGQPASVACDDVALRDCVVKAHMRCEDFWDFVCTDQAMFRCGAKCTGPLR